MRSESQFESELLTFPHETCSSEEEEEEEEDEEDDVC